MVSELIDKVGKECYIYVDGLKIKCRVKDIHTNYGQTDYLIKPVSGCGETWKRNVHFENNLNNNKEVIK